MNEQPSKDNLPIGREQDRASDLVSQNLQRRATIGAITGVVGVLLGFVSLLLAGEKGEIGWLITAVIGAVLGAMLVVSYSRRTVSDLIGWLIVGFLSLCWVAIGTPSVAQGESGGGAKNLFISEAGLILLLLIWGVDIFLRQRINLIKTPVNLPIALYLLTCALSTAAGVWFPNQTVLQDSPKIAFQVNLLENVLRWLALGGLLMVGNKLRGKTLIGGALAIALPGIVTYSGAVRFLATGLFMVFPQVISMGVLAAFAVSDVPWMKKWMRIVAAAIALSILGTYFIKGAEWVSGWAAALLALAVVCWYSQRRLLWGGIAAIVLVIASNPIYFYNKMYADNFYGKQLRAPSEREKTGMFENDRLRMMKAATRYASTFPLGVGLGNYRSYNNYFGRPDVWNTTKFTSAHGTYSQALSETGWAGLLSLLAIIYASCRIMRQYYLRLPPKSWARPYVLGGYGACLGTFFASIIGDYIFPTYHNGGLTSFGNCVYTWFFIGITIAIGREHGISLYEPPQESGAAPTARYFRDEQGG